MVSLIFLIFDVELVILYPIIVFKSEIITNITLISFSLFIVFIVGGLALEWGRAKLDWFIYQKYASENGKSQLCFQNKSFSPQS